MNLDLACDGIVDLQMKFCREFENERIFIHKLRGRHFALKKKNWSVAVVLETLVC